MARKQHLINVHTSTGTTAPTGASLYLGEIAVQHTPNEPALWIKVGSAETSTEYEKFIGLTEITDIFNMSQILGSGYTYSGLPYVNSSTTIADAYSALTQELFDDELVVSSALNTINDRLDNLILGPSYIYSGLPYINSAATIPAAYSALTSELLKDEKTVAAALNNLNDRVNELSGNSVGEELVEYVQENEEVVAGALNDLNERVGTLETHMNGEYILLTGYELASGLTEEELSLTEEDTVNEAFGKLQKQMLDNEESIAAGFNDLNERLENVDEIISHNTGITQLSGAVQSLSANVNSLSAGTCSTFDDVYDTISQNWNELSNLSSATQSLSSATRSLSSATRSLSSATQSLSASVMSISAKTNGVLTLNLNGVEQGKYSPSASTTINLEAIQEVTGADVLLTGYELASGTTEEELAILPSDTVNEAFGKIQKQNYDNEELIANALNDLDERIGVLEADSGLTVLSASVVNNKNDIVALSGAVTSVSHLEEITWSELKTLRDSSGLTPGMQYRITDYNTTTSQANTQAAGHQFDIIVVADSVNKLNENARAVLHNGDTYFSTSGANLNAWEIKYSLDNDDKRFYWAVTGSTGRGVIYYMKDEWNNECPYDFKNIQFPRYEITACPKSPSLVGQYSVNGIGDITVDTATTYWCYTFTWINANDEIEDLSIVGQTLPNDEGHYNGVFGNKISYGSYPGSPSSFTFALSNNCLISTYGYEGGLFYGCFSNRLESDCRNNTFLDYCFSNTFGKGCSYNTFANDCFQNTFGDDCYYNTFGNNCSYNTFGAICAHNTFGDSCAYNTFGNSCGTNTFENNCGTNTFGDSCAHNTFGDGSAANTFGDSCAYNTFGNSCVYNTFGNHCQQTIFNKDYVQNVIIENGNQYITLTSTQAPTSALPLRNITIAQGVNNSTTRKTISHNTLNDTFKTTYQSANSQVINI